MATAPALTGMAGLVFAAFVPSLTSDAVSVHVPAVLLVRDRDFVPEAKAVLDGSTALGSVEVIATVSLTFVTTFQLESTALTVTL